MRRLTNASLVTTITVWSKTTKDIHRHRRRLRSAQLHFKKKACGMVLGAWYADVKETKENFKKMRKAMQRIGNLSVHLKVEKWQQYTARCRALKHSAVQIRKKMVRRVSKRTLADWKCTIETEASAATAIQNKIMKFQTTAVKVCFDCWRRYAFVSYKANRLKLRLKFKLVRLAWIQMCAHHEERHRIKMTAAGVCQREPKMLLQAACECWRRSFRNKRRRKAKAASAAARLFKLKAKPLLDDWVEAVKASKKSARIFTFITQSTSQRTINRVFRSWLERASLQKHLRVAHSRTKQILGRAKFMKSFEDWHCTCVYDRQCSKKIATSTAKIERRQIRRAWQAWMISIVSRKMRTAEIYGRRAAVAETRLCTVKLTAEVGEIVNGWGKEVSSPPCFVSAFVNYA
jgi:hypothetical protein